MRLKQIAMKLRIIYDSLNKQFRQNENMYKMELTSNYCLFCGRMPIPFYEQYSSDSVITYMNLSTPFPAPTSFASVIRPHFNQHAVYILCDPNLDFIALAFSFMDSLCFSHLMGIKSESIYKCLCLLTRTYISLT